MFLNQIPNVLLARMKTWLLEILKGLFLFETIPSEFLQFFRKKAVSWSLMIEKVCWFYIFSHTYLHWLIEVTFAQCGNWKIFLPLRFYVKTIFEKSQILPIWRIKWHGILHKIRAANQKSIWHRIWVTQKFLNFHTVF